MNQLSTTTQAVLSMLSQALETARADPDAWRRATQVNLLTKCTVAITDPPSQASTAEEVAQSAELQRQLNAALRIVAAEKDMRTRVFKRHGSRRTDKLAEMDQVTDLLIALARRCGLSVPEEQAATQAQQGVLFEGW